MPVQVSSKNVCCTDLPFFRFGWQIREGELLTNVYLQIKGMCLGSVESHKGLCSGRICKVVRINTI